MLTSSHGQATARPACQRRPAPAAVILPLVPSLASARTGGVLVTTEEHGRGS
jgi:hypothetical protein